MIYLKNVERTTRENVDKTKGNNRTAFNLEAGYSSKWEIINKLNKL